MAQLNTGLTWVSGDTVTAAKLNQMINQATVRSEVISDQASRTTTTGADLVIIESNGNLYKAALSTMGADAIWNANKLQGKSVSSTAPTSGDYLKWDDTNTEWVGAAVPTIGTGEVSTSMLADDAVTSDKIADDAVGADQLSETAVTAGSYTNASVTVDAQGRLTAASSGDSFPSISVQSDNTSIGNDTSVTVPSGTFLVTGTIRYYMGSNNGVLGKADLKDSSGTVIDTVTLGAGNEAGGTDGGSGMYVRDSFCVGVPSNCATVRFYRGSGSNSMSGEVSQFVKFA